MGFATFQPPRAGAESTATAESRRGIPFGETPVADQLRSSGAFGG